MGPKETDGSIPSILQYTATDMRALCVSVFRVVYLHLFISINIIIYKTDLPWLLGRLLVSSTLAYGHCLHFILNLVNAKFGL